MQAAIWKHYLAISPNCAGLFQRRESSQATIWHLIR
jgi:hypothetical protein